MKKLVAIILVLTFLTGVLAGCGPEVPSGQVTSEQPASDPSDQTPDTVSLGRLEGGVYTNTYAGIGCSLDESWTYYSAEELQELPANISEVLEGSLGEDALTKNPSITDMMAENTASYGNINVVYTYLPLTERLTYKLLNDSDLIEMTLETGEAALRSSYETMGLEEISFEQVIVTFLGENRVALKTHGITSGVDYYILQIFDYSLGAYGVTVTASSFGEDTTQDLLNVFYAVEE